MEENKGKRQPVVGLRTLKTVLATMLAAGFMQYIVKENPFFACIGAVAAMDKTVKSSFRAAFVRNVVTFTGGVISIAISSFTDSIVLVSIGLIPFIWLNNKLDTKEGIVPGATVYFAVAHLNTMQGAWLYGVRRIAGTFVGTLFALAVNALVFPLKEQELQAQADEAERAEVAALPTGE